MAGGELEPVGRSGPALAEVAAEMNEIFDRAGLGQPAPGLRRPAAVAALRPGRVNGSATALLITAAATGVLGLGAGAFVIRMPGPRAPADAKVAAQSQPRPIQPQPQPQLRPQAKPEARPQLPVTPPIALAEAAPPPVVDVPPVQPRLAAKVSPKARRAAPVSRSTRSRAEFRLKLARLDGPRPAQAKPPIRLPAPVAQPASCERDAGGEDCRHAVVQADRHLRAIYENAIERGVSRRVLVDYRDRWADLRDRDNENPARLIENYGALAYDLRRERADDQDEAQRPKGRSGLKALTDLLLPWW